MATWIAMEEACRRLGVKPQTVYAYVSRGKLEVSPDPADTRRSLYRAEDVAALARRKQDGRKHETLAANTLFGAEPSIPTSLSTFARGRLYYRGQDVVALAESATLEDVARLLWHAERGIAFATPDPAPVSDPGRARAFVNLAALAANGHSTRGRVARVLHEEARGLVAQIAAAFGAGTAAGGPIHERLASGWGQSASVGKLLRPAMVLLADHELTSSAFAARVAASTGASLPACLLAGLMTLSGPMHGDASGRVQALFGEVERLGESEVAERHLSAAMPIAGFGHHLYPDGDPRAAALLARFEPPKAIGRFMQKVTDLTGLLPNIDFALAALAARHRLPEDAAFAIMATARSVGLLAHVMEQLSVEQVIRPRGRYAGEVPEAPRSTAPDPQGSGGPRALSPAPQRRRRGASRA